MAAAGPSTAPGSTAGYVEQAVCEGYVQRPWEGLVGQAVLGSRDFIEELTKRVRGTRPLCPEEASAPADIRAGCRRGGKAQSSALEYVSRSAQGLGARSGRVSGPATARVDAAAIGESDRRGQCGSGQRGGEAFPTTPGNRSAAAGAGRTGRSLFVECSKLTPIPHDSYLSNVQSGPHRRRPGKEWFCELGSGVGKVFSP